MEASSKANSPKKNSLGRDQAFFESVDRHCREPEVKSVGKPDARNGHVRFDERDWETGRRFGVSAHARPRLYLLGSTPTDLIHPRTALGRVDGLDPLLN
jgi:hypothetical protein